ncbi:MAG: hypothetical protein GX116_07915 [Fibrobacter sp.]|jgi:hypothetical protein|nr:hypothetical protein [Fibrobacter sp.]
MQFILFFLSMSVYASQMATTYKGATVILHDDGRWEYYQNNTKVRDVRPSSLPEQAKVHIYATHESYEKLRKNKRLELEADYAPEEEILDSLRKIPKGGLLHFCVKTEQLTPHAVQTYTYSVWTGTKKPIYERSIADSEAVPSDESGVSYLVSVPLYARLKVKKIKARVENKNSKQSLDYEIPVNP